MEKMADNITVLGVVMQEIQITTPHNDVIIINDTDDVISPMISNKEALEMTRLIVQRILVPIITSIGLFGNILSICVLTRKCMISSTNCYLLTLSVFDLLYLILGFTLSLKHYPMVKSQHIYMYMYPYVRGLTDICSNVSVCLTVTFSLERLVAVCYPMKGRTICTPERARIISTIITVFAIACTAPEFFEWIPVSVTKNNETKVVIRTSDMAEHVSYQVGYNYFIICTFTILPLILLSTCNGILIKSVLAATKIRRELTYSSISKEPNRRKNEQNRITLMLISVVVVFLVCQFPNAAVLLYNCYIDLKEITLSEEQINNIRIAGNIVNLLVLINASVNFVLYSLMSTKFRRVLLNLVCGLFRGRYDQYSRTEMTFYNSAMSRSQGSPLRFRSKRLSSSSINGYNRKDSVSCRYVTCPAEVKRQCESMSRRQSSIDRTNNTSVPETKMIREPLQRSMSRNARSTAMKNGETLHKIYGVENEIAIWETVTALQDIKTETMKETICLRNRDLQHFGRSDSFEIVHNRFTYICSLDGPPVKDTTM